MAQHAAEVEKMKAFIQQQAEFEGKVTKKVLEQREKTPYPNPEVECRQPT
jgi:tRNA U34 2-thiouridine synthase MnmA/TrmU